MSEQTRLERTLENERRARMRLEDENLKLREQLKKIAGGSDELELESGVNKSLDGFVTVRWGAEVGQLSPEQARKHGLAVLECAEAAESDAAVLRALRSGGFDDETGFGLLRLIRDNRKERNATG